jgi:hypothetical protein
MREPGPLPCGAYRSQQGGQLWVDAIRINQDDNGQKSPQVNLMSVFYQQAEKVLVWLGCGADGSGAVMTTAMEKRDL